MAFTVTGSDLPDTIWQEKRTEFVAALLAEFPTAKRTLRGNYTVSGDDAETRVRSWLAGWLMTANAKREAR